VERFLRRDPALKIIKVFEKEYPSSTYYVGLTHLNIHIGNMRRNFDTARKLAMYMYGFEPAILVLPYMQPYGPIHTKITEQNRTRFKTYFLSLRSWYLRDLLAVARNYGINIAIPGILERAGSRKFISAIYLPGSFDEKPVVHRKVILDDREEELGLSAGKLPKVFTLGDVEFSMVIDSELFYPELSRVYSVLADFIVAGLPQNEPLKRYLNAIKLVSQITGFTILVPGSRVYSSNKLYYTTPTLIVSEGDIVFKYNEEEQAIIFVPIEKLVRSNKSVDKYILKLLSILRKYLAKKVERSGTRKGNSYKNG